MHPLSPSHQTLFAAYETYLRQKTLVDASRKRLLRLARRYLHYLDTEYPGIEATRISYPQCYLPANFGVSQGKYLQPVSR